MTTSTKLEVHNTVHCHHRRIEQCAFFRYVSRQIYTDTDHNTVYCYRMRSNYLSLVASWESCIAQHRFEVADELECVGSKPRRVPERLVSTSAVPSTRDDTPCCLLCRKSRDESLQIPDIPCLCPFRTLSSCHKRSSFVRLDDDFDVPLMCAFDDTPPPTVIIPRPARTG